MSWLAFFSLQLSVIVVILGFGCWVAGKIVAFFRIDNTFFIDRICVAVFVIVSLFAIFGVVVLFFPWEIRQALSVLFLISVFSISCYLVCFGKQLVDVTSASWVEKSFLFGVVAMSGLTLAIAMLPAKLPEQLVDGPYVAKHDYLGVRIQYIAGNYPADNSLPHVINEYLLRDISFKRERPVMPGQEVSNRPILVSLFLVPIRGAFYPPSRLPAGLPKFSYVGNLWPDFSVLMEDDFGYLFSLSVGIVLNALVFLSLGAYVVRAKSKSVLISGCVTALILSSPYFVFQTLFTWPKELAAFFVLFAIVLYCRLGSPKLAGWGLALAYLSHPYAVVFFIGFVLHFVFSNFRGERVGIEKGRAWLSSGSKYSSRYFGEFSIVFIVVVLPWFFWIKLVLQIPSDLISQNLFQSGQGFVDFLWVRPVNFFSAVLPGYLLRYPFDVNGIVLGGAVTIPGAIGVCIYVFSLMCLFNESFDKDKLFLVYLPSVFLICIFSNQAVPVLHGLQGPIALFLLAGVIQLHSKLGAAWAVIVSVMQVLVNLLLLGRYLFVLV